VHCIATPQVLYLFKGATGLVVDRNAPGLVCVENVFLRYFVLTHSMFMLSQLVNKGWGKEREKKGDLWGKSQGRILHGEA
jgi:hypothetical protein